MREERFSMTNIQIFSDSTCDLPPYLLEKHHIGLIPLYVVFGDDSYRDGVDLTPEQLYEMVDRRGTLPKTAAPSPADFYKAFEPAIKAGKQILYIGLSSGISSTQQNAKIAAEEFPAGSIEIVDSLNLSNGIGLLVMKAADYAAEGMELSRIAGLIRGMVPDVETEFVIDTLDYLYKGGRCSGVQMLLGSLLKIRPVIKVVEGGMILAEKLRGKHEKVLEALLHRVLAHKDEIEPDRIFIPNSMTPESSLWLKERLEKELHFGEIVISEAGCVISSHCGKNTVGVIYRKKQG